MATNPACVHLNRNLEILPDDNRLVFLQSMGGGLENQYINAVRVNCLDRKDAFITAEHPQLHTVELMWTLVYERKIPVWLMLHTFPENDEEFPQVIPFVERQPVGMFELTLTGCQTFKNFEEYYIEMSIPKFNSAPSHMCVLVVMKDWPHVADLPTSIEPLLAVMERAESLVNTSTSSLITCRDGVTATGMMVALFLVVERIKLFQEVDVYRSVQEIIYARPQFITCAEQYELLHTAAAVYLQAYDNYQNFA